MSAQNSGHNTLKNKVEKQAAGYKNVKAQSVKTQEKLCI